MTDALKAFRDANQPAAPPADGQSRTGGQGGGTGQVPGKVPGIDEAKVKAALEELRTEAQKSGRQR